MHFLLVLYDYPTQQGLKLDELRSDLEKSTVLYDYPTQQGLKPESFEPMLNDTGGVLYDYPTQQGLKLS